MPSTTTGRYRVLSWGISKATVSRILNKLQEKEYLSLVSFTGRNGSVIYLCSYLSTMFNISDVMIDKEEISMTFQIPVHVPEASSLPEAEPIREEQISIMEAENNVSGQAACVSKPHMKKSSKKWRKSLRHKGFRAVNAPELHISYIPYPTAKKLLLSIPYRSPARTGRCPTGLS